MKGRQERFWDFVRLHFDCLKRWNMIGDMMGMDQVEKEADSLYGSLHNREHIGYVNGFRHARLILRNDGENILLEVIANYRPTSFYGIPPDEYDVGFKCGMEQALSMFLEE